MRINRLKLERFGHFTDRDFDFGTAPDGTDFHIIYGPNEAGKTTTMEAVLRLFYGFPLREDYAFKHPRSNLQISATLEIDGATRHFTRLPRRSGSLVDQTGTALPETALSAALAGLSEEDYRRLLCLDDETIERGGEEIVNAQGDIGRLLFQAASGVSGLSAVLDGIRDRADTLWKRRGRTTTIIELKRALAEVERQIKDRDITASAWRALKRDLAKAQDAEQAARTARDALIAARARTEAQRRALPLLAEIVALEEAIAPFSSYPDHLDFDPERLIELRSDRGICSQNIDRLTEEIAALRERRAAIRFEPALEALSRELDALEDLSARDRGAQLDLDRRVAEHRVAEAEMQHTAHDLAGTAVDPQRLVLSATDIAALDEAQKTLRDATRQLHDEAREMSDLQDRVRAASDALQDSTPDAGGPLRMRDVLLRFDADHLAPAHAAACQAIDTARRSAANALAELSVGEVTFDHLPPCPTSRSQATEWADLYRDLSADLRKITEKHTEHMADLAALNARAEALTQEGAGLVSDTEAAALLAARDARWSEHVRALDGATASAFEAALRLHDTAAQTRLNQSRELAQLREIGQDEAAARARAEQAAETADRLRHDCAALQASVAEAAAQIAPGSRMTPAEWLDWVIRHGTAREAAQVLRDTEASHHATLLGADALLSELARLLPFRPETLSSALNAARNVAEKEREQDEARAKAEAALHQAQRDLVRRRDRHAAAQTAFDAAQATWHGLIRTSLGEAVSPERLRVSVEPLRLLREQEKTRAAAEHRITSMRADQDRFAKAVTALAQAQGLAVEASAAKTYAALKESVDAARAGRETADTLERDIETAIDAKTRDENRVRAIDHEIITLAAGFPETAASGDIDRLRQIAGQAQRVIEQRASAAKLRRSVLSELAVEDIAMAQAQVAGLSVAGLEAALESNGSDLAHAEDALTQAIHARATAEHALSAVRGDDEIAALVEQKATLELELEEAALAYLELSMGHALASEAIRRYRDQHRGSMMSATERCFANLTQGAYPVLKTQHEKDTEVLLSVDRNGVSKRAAEMSKGTRFQLYLALRAAAHEQLVAQGTTLPFFCDDIFETFDDARTSAACRVMETIGRRGQAIYLTHHRHVVEIARRVCDTPPVIHEM